MTTNVRGPEVATRPVHVVFLNWRDTRNPDGGGSERYVESVARGLVASGKRVTVVCAAHAHAPAHEVDEGVQFIRRGGKLTVYLAAARLLATGALRPYDVIVDVQNGIPFFSRIFTRRPVIVLVHHVHREQWPVVYGSLVAQLGWWLESAVAPRLYRGCQYVAVSGVTRLELIGLGVHAEDIAVVHNGTDPAPAVATARDVAPTICVLGRLVPHKRVEQALRAVAALRCECPGLRCLVVGDGWWMDELRSEAGRLGVEDVVEFTGFVSEEEKHHCLARSWVLAAPSLKEGWGLCVMEAASHGVPTVAHAHAGGLSESIVDGETGLLVEESQQAFTNGLRVLINDSERRNALGQAARVRATGFTWEQTVASFEVIVEAATRGERVGGEDPGTGPAIRGPRLRAARLRRLRPSRRT